MWNVGFTAELKENHSLPFLDVLIKGSDNGLITYSYVYRNKNL